MNALTAAAVCWLLSELLELMFGGRTALTLALTALFHLLMSVGIWRAYRAQAGTPSTLSRAATTAASVGFLVLVYPPMAVLFDRSIDITTLMRGVPALGLAGALATLGVMAFGAAILRYRSYAQWVGIVLLVCPATFTWVMLSGAPDGIGITANIIEAVALLAMGLTSAPALS